uniref:Uncharacterized protein n=1 Tax=Arundo donax TaxID=35708 RepID=A0A0A9EHP3_ARUDO
MSACQSSIFHYHHLLKSCYC